MTAYAALLSLSKVIDLTLSQEHKYVHLCSIEQMTSLHEEIGRLQDLLEHLHGRSHPSIDVLESRIREVVYRLEDIIEEGTPSSFKKFTSSCTRLLPIAISPSAFGRCAREIGILLKKATKMKEEGPSLTTKTSSSDQPPTAKLDLDDVPVEIMDWIFCSEAKLQIVPITGMGGIGKTTLARAVYEHPNTLCHFDICSWATISQEFNVKEILHGLLSSDQQSTPDERLIEFVHKRLKGRRYLIVLDDMWDVKALGSYKECLPR